MSVSVSDNTKAVLLVALGGLAGYALLSKKSAPQLPLPPSPKSHPLFGHLFALPSDQEEVGYRDISKELNSDIISFTVFGQTIVVLNSMQSAVELLTKRGITYSDRPELPMVNDERLAGWGRNTGLLPYGDRWKRQRLLSQEGLNPKAGEELWPKMVKQARKSAQHLLKRPEGVLEEVQWMASAMLLSAIYGYEPSYPFDQRIETVTTAFSGMCEAAMPANFYVNTLPWMVHIPAWAPGAAWKRRANEIRAWRDKAINEPFDWTKSQMAANKATPSMLKNLLTKMATSEVPKHGIEEEEDMLRWVTGTLYATASDTLVSTIKTFILAMVLHPEVQKKAQEEIDRVLGGRMPELSDRPALPYLNAVMREVFRWRTSVPISVPRRTLKEDVYKGYRIPKGSIVIMNTWAISNDPDVYPEPDKFNPERFMDPTLPKSPDFGLGRRDCPGANFAEHTFFIMASTLLSIYNMGPTPGKPYPEAKATKGALASHPFPFDSTLTPRSESRKQAMEQWIDH